MGTVLITIKIMPDDVDTDLAAIEVGAKRLVEKFDGNYSGSVKEPVAFGLNALVIRFSFDEKNNNLEPLEDNLRNVDGVAGVEVTDMRKALG